MFDTHEIVVHQFTCRGVQTLNADPYHTHTQPLPVRVWDRLSPPIITREAPPTRPRYTLVRRQGLLTAESRHRGQNGGEGRRDAPQNKAYPLPSAPGPPSRV